MRSGEAWVSSIVELYSIVRRDLSAPLDGPNGHERVDRSPPAIQIPPNPHLRKGGRGDFMLRCDPEVMAVSGDPGLSGFYWTSACAGGDD
jgi:hypothetical protein